MSKAQPTSAKEQKQSSKDPANNPPAKAPSAKKTTATKGKPKAKGSDGKKKGEEEIEGAPLMLVPNGKEQRTKDEEKFKVLYIFCVCIITVLVSCDLLHDWG